MTDIVKGMANTLHSFWVRKVCEQKPWLQGKDGGIVPEDIEGMKIAVLYLAENGSEAIAKHLCRAVYGIPVDNPIPAPMLDSMTWRIAASIRAVAGDEVK